MRCVMTRVLPVPAPASTATGPRSEIGRIGVALGSLETEPPRLRAQTRALVRYAGAGAILVTVLVILLSGLLRVMLIYTTSRSGP